MNKRMRYTLGWSDISALHDISPLHHVDFQEFSGFYHSQNYGEKGLSDSSVELSVNEEVTLGSRHQLVML